MSAAPVLVDRLGRPMASPAGGHLGGIARKAGGHRGTMAGWLPYRHNRASAPYERELIARRAEDLAANDAHAAGLVDSMAVNVAGTGLVPQSRLDAAALGITEEQASALRDAFEAEFASWAKKADAGDRMTFDQFQLLDMRGTMVQGEYLNLCVSMARSDGSLPPGRRYAMALQSLHPSRLRTPPAEALNPQVRDGVALGAYGEPLGYWIAQPDSFGSIDYAALSNAAYYPAAVAHRPVCLHAFPQRQPEQVRGVPILAPAMKFFRDLADCLDYELVGQLVTAAFPVAIAADVNPLVQAGIVTQDNLPWRPTDDRVSEVSPGSVIHLYPGEEAKVLDAPRPGSNFDSFVTRILRAAGAAAGLPYEVVVKDFSKTNYSSARAALLEAWRVFRIYQDWLESALCVRVWCAVLEETVARGYVEIPAEAPPFWLADGTPDPRYLACDWIPPSRGHVDPTKEIEADIEAVEAGLATKADVIAARGGDWEAVAIQRKREQDRDKQLGLAPAPTPAGPGRPATDQTQDSGDEPIPSDEQPTDQTNAQDVSLVGASTPASSIPPDIRATLDAFQAFLGTLSAFKPEVRI